MTGSVPSWAVLQAWNESGPGDTFDLMRTRAQVIAERRVCGAPLVRSWSDPLTCERPAGHGPWHGSGDMEWTD